MAACLFNRSDDALCLQILKDEFTQARRGHGRGIRSRFDTCRAKALTSYIHQVVTLLERTPPLQMAAIDYLTGYPHFHIIRTLMLNDSILAKHIAKVLLTQLDCPVTQEAYKVTRFLGTIAQDNQEARSDVFRMLPDSNPCVRQNVIRTLLHMSQKDDDCWKAVLKTSYDKVVHVRAEAITRLGKMYWARNLHKDRGKIDPRDFEALSIILGAMDHADLAIEHAAVQAVKSLGCLATPGMVESLIKKLWHPMEEMKLDALKAFAFHMLHMGRSALPELVTVMENQMESDMSRRLATMAIVSAGYGDRCVAHGEKLNQYPEIAVKGLILGAGLKWDFNDDSGIAENAIIGLMLMAPRNIWPHRQLIDNYWRRFQVLPDTDYKKDFGEVVSNIRQWEQQLCAWAVACELLVSHDIRLAILHAFLDVPEDLH